MIYEYRIKKIAAFFFIVLIFFTLGFSVKAGDSNSDLIKQGIFGKFKLFLSKVAVWVLEGAKKAIIWCKNKMSDFWQWLKTRQGAVKQGIEEEKIEFKESWANLSKFFGKFSKPSPETSK